jgi:hypothetical protein
VTHGAQLAPTHVPGPCYIGKVKECPTNKYVSPVNEHKGYKMMSIHIQLENLQLGHQINSETKKKNLQNNW